MDQPDTTAIESATRPLGQTVLLYWALIGSILFNVVYFSLGAIVPDYDMMRQSIGDLELINHGWIQSVNFVAVGLSICAFAYCLRKEMVSGFGIMLIPLSQVFTAFGLILSGVFIHDPIHTAGGVIAFAAQAISFLLFARRLKGDTRWKGWRNYTLISVLLMLVFLALYLFASHRNGPYAGVLERLVVVTRLVWTALFIIQLLGGRRFAAREQSV